MKLLILWLQDLSEVLFKNPSDIYIQRRYHVINQITSIKNVK